MATDVSSSGWITGTTPVNDGDGDDGPTTQVFRLKPAG